LRGLLSYNGFAPLRYVRFLDEATERLFLRRAGSGYIFVHRLLLEHFAGLDTTRDAEEEAFQAMVRAACSGSTDRLKRRRGGVYESADGCEVEGCLGMLVEVDGCCLAHTSPQLRKVKLNQLHNGGRLDARGVPIDTELLKEILDAAPRDEEGRPHLKQADFRGAEFFGEACFRNVRFSGGIRTNFEDTQFNDEEFWDVRFYDEIRTNFEDAQFHGRADFGDARFNGVTNFGDTQFEETAIFYKTRFSDWVEFAGAQFGWAEFAGAQFDGGAGFSRAQFEGEANFTNARFKHNTCFGPLFVSEEGSLRLDAVTFGRGSKIEVGARQISCIGLGSSDDASNLHLRVRWAEVDFSEAGFSRPTIVSPLPFADFRTIAELPDWASPKDQLSRPRVVSLCRANVAELVLTDVDLSACRFDGAHNLDQLRLEGDTTFAQPPKGWRRTRFGPWRWTRRDTLANEQQWRAREGYAKSDGWYSDETGAAPRPRLGEDEPPLTPRRIASLYRDLRKAREDAKDEPGAADFYYGEMEMRRLDSTRAWPERTILFFYWLMSGYGLRAWRALTSLGALWLLFSALFAWAGFAATHSFRTAAVYTARMAIGLPNPRLLPTTLTGDVLQIVWRLAAPVLLGLAVLSIRGRVKR
jgi:uncharacterized protein YjbI with pentapeptide repeats